VEFKLLHVAGFVTKIVGCNAVWGRRYVPTFRRNILPPSSGLKSTQCYRLKDRDTYSKFKPSANRTGHICSRNVAMKTYTATTRHEKNSSTLEALLAEAVIRQSSHSVKTDTVNKEEQRCNLFRTDVHTAKGHVGPKGIQQHLTIQKGEEWRNRAFTGFNALSKNNHHLHKNYNDPFHLPQFFPFIRFNSKKKKSLLLTSNMLV
jgi:hypothetical protein